jgi:hypothetical protein
MGIEKAGLSSKSCRNGGSTSFDSLTLPSSRRRSPANFRHEEHCAELCAASW